MTRCLVAAVTGDKVLLQHTSWFDFVSFWWKFLEGGRGGIKKGYREKKKRSKFMSFCSSPSVQAGLCPVTVHPLGSDEGVWRTATSLLCNRQETPGAYKTPNVIWFLRVWRLFAPHTHRRSNSWAWYSPGSSAVQISFKGVEEKLSRHGF